MLEMDCVLNGLRHQFEVGETKDAAVIFCKSSRPLSVMRMELASALGRFGLEIEFMAEKSDLSGNVLKLRMINTGAWDRD